MSIWIVVPSLLVFTPLGLYLFGVLLGETLDQIYKLRTRAERIERDYEDVVKMIQSDTTSTPL